MNHYLRRSKKMKAVAKKKINVGNAEDDTMPGPTPAQIKAAKAKAEKEKAAKTKKKDK